LSSSNVFLREATAMECDPTSEKPNSPASGGHGNV
jgi:hypothetical protein